MVRDEDSDLLQRVGSQLGIRYDGKVRQYFVAVLSLAMTAPDDVVKRIRAIPDIVDYVIPDPRFTQGRVVELAWRVEIAARCARLILDRAGQDFLEQAITSFTEPFRERLPRGRPPTETELKVLSADIGRGMEELLGRYSTRGDPALSAAVKILFEGGIFDLDQRRPTARQLFAIGMGALPMRPAQPVRTTRKARRGGE